MEKSKNEQEARDGNLKAEGNRKNERAAQIRTHEYTVVRTLQKRYRNAVVMVRNISWNFC